MKKRSKYGELVSHLPILSERSQHHHSCTLPIIDDLPEVPDSGRQRVLGNDVCLSVLVALQEEGQRSLISYVFVEEKTLRSMTHMCKHSMDVVRLLSLDYHTTMID